MARAVIFFEFEIFFIRFGISVPKDKKKMGGVAIALPKNGDNNPAYCATTKTFPITSPM